jgi:hypothetical protein
MVLGHLTWNKNKRFSSAKELFYASHDYLGRSGG